MDDPFRDTNSRLTPRQKCGAASEAAALEYLQRRGLRLVARNHRCKAGEIDLVMLDGATLVLFEVRFRSDSSFGGAAASVTWRKQRRIARAAQHLLLVRAELRRYPARFDVIAVSPDGGALRVEWIKNAFMS